jgi:hypothetical protein
MTPRPEYGSVEWAIEIADNIDDADLNDLLEAADILSGDPDTHADRLFRISGELLTRAG